MKDYEITMATKQGQLLQGCWNAVGCWLILQVWRPLRGPVDESPLAVVDAQTVKHEDFVPVRLELPGRTGSTYQVKHDPGDSIESKLSSAPQALESFAGLLHLLLVSGGIHSYVQLHLCSNCGHSKQVYILGITL